MVRPRGALLLAVSAHDRVVEVTRIAEPAPRPGAPAEAEGEGDELDGDDGTLLEELGPDGLDEGDELAAPAAAAEPTTVAGGSTAPGASELDLFT